MQEFIYGIHVIRSLLDKDPDRILEIYILNEKSSNSDKDINNLLSTAKNFGIAIHPLDKKSMDKLSSSNASDSSSKTVHQGIIAKVRAKKAMSFDDLIEEISIDSNQNSSANNSVLLLILDGVQDPHNLGACLRTAEAFGVKAIIIPKDRSVSVTATVRKIASGAAEIVPVIEVTNLVRSIEELKEQNVWIMGTSAEASKSINEVDLKGRVAIVMGAEGQGLRRLTEECCDVLMKIPMHGSIESLNVSVATGICLYEASRQSSH